MITCIIIDDEEDSRDALELILKRYFPDRAKVLDKAGSLKEGVFSINEHKPDIVFLDIEMQDDNGFNLFKYFQEIDFSVIFVTAYKEYAIKAVKVAALDYLLKPISVNDLKSALDLYEQKKNKGIKSESLQSLTGLLNPGTFVNEKVALPTFTGYHVEKISSIIYCEADQNYTNVFTTDNGELLISKPLNSIQNLLPDSIFFRIHKSFLINLNYVRSFNRLEGLYVILENGKKLDVAFRRKDDFLKVLTRKR